MAKDTLFLSLQSIISKQMCSQCVLLHTVTTIIITVYLFIPVGNLKFNHIH